MAHYALLDENSIVTQVIVGRDENDLPDGIADWESYYGNNFNQVCKRTSYNTVGGVHELDGTPFRKNYAGIGYVYDAEKDAFIPPKPYSSWVLNEDTCLWNAPVEAPLEGGPYAWNEETTSWDPVTE